MYWPVKKAWSLSSHVFKPKLFLSLGSFPSKCQHTQISPILKQNIMNQTKPVPWICTLALTFGFSKRVFQWCFLTLITYIILIASWKWSLGSSLNGIQVIKSNRIMGTHLISPTHKIWYNLVWSSSYSLKPLLSVLTTGFLVVSLLTFLIFSQSSNRPLFASNSPRLSCQCDLILWFTFHLM